MSTSQLTKGISRSIAPLCFELLFASFCVSRGNQLPTQGKRWEVKEKKYIYSLYSSSSANTGIVKQSAKHFALRGWTSGGTIIMTHFSLSLLDSSVTRGVLGMRNQASLFNVTRATAIRPFLFPRVPWVMEKVTVTRIELLRLLRTEIEHQKKTVVIACCL